MLGPQVTVLGENQGMVDLTLRRKRVIKGEPAPEVTFQEGQLVAGFVLNCSSRGCFVRLTRTKVCRVFPRNLSDTFIKVGKKIRVFLYLLWCLDDGTVWSEQHTLVFRCQCQTCW